jgi:hypothetical protein
MQKVQKELSPLEIELELQSLPRKLWKANCSVVLAQQGLLTSEMNYEDALDKCYLTTKAAHPDMTVREVEATANEACRALRLDYIMSQAKYEKARNDSKFYETMNGNMQSIVKLRSSEMRSGLQSSH